MQATRTIPIAFVQVIDPVGSGFVKSLARPGGNITGFTQFEYSLAAKWAELLKQIAATGAEPPPMEEQNMNPVIDAPTTAITDWITWRSI